MKRALPALAWMLTVSVMLSGCATDVQEVDHPASLELGAGSWRFETLADGQELELVRGAQGGWHVWISVRTRGLDDEPLITLALQPENESREPVETTVRANLDPEDDEGYRDLVGHTQIIDEPSCMVGEMMHLEARVEVDGETLTSDRYFTVLGGTYPPPSCE